MSRVPHGASNSEDIASPSAAVAPEQSKLVGPQQVVFKGMLEGVVGKYSIYMYIHYFMSKYMPRVQYFSLEIPRSQFLESGYIRKHLSCESLIWTNETHPGFSHRFNRWLFHMLFPLLHATNLLWYPSAQHRSPNSEGWRPDQGPRFHRNHVCLIWDPSRLLVLLTYLHEIDEKTQ